MNTKMDGVARIAAERERQKSVEGWTPEHDAEHGDFSLAQAACSYVWFASQSNDYRANYKNTADYPTIWPWDEAWWKPRDRLRDLERAGALIAAEIDRILAQDAALTGAEGVDNG